MGGGISTASSYRSESGRMRRSCLQWACCGVAAALPLASSFSMGGISNPMTLRILSTNHKINRRYKQQHPYSSTTRGSSILSLATGANEEELTKVIVVGAGFAGLSTAYNLWKLANNSKKKLNIEILEVRDRIGGRVHPITIDNDTWIDLGGQWLHESCPENPIRRLMEDDLKIGFVDSFNDKSKNRFHKKRLKNALFDVNGNPLNTASIQRAKIVFYKAMDDENFYDGKDKNSVSIRDLLEARIQIEKFSDQRRNRSISSSPSFDLAMNYFVHRMEENEGEKLEEVSAFLDLYREPGGPDRVVKGSYQSLLQALSSKMGLNNNIDNNQHAKVQLRQNAKVERIDYRDSNQISLSVVDTEGDSAATTIDCDYCVCTVPLGVLQQGKIDFSPALPQTRQEAIDGIGMGLLNKIVFVFDLDETKNKFWGELEQFGICHEDPSLIKTYYDCTNDYYCDSNSNSAILVQFLAGSAADRVDSINNSPGLTDEEAVEESLQALRGVFGNIPNPTVAKVTRWRQDPWACGSYSFAKVGSSKEMYDEIASPLGRLLFAGEHTSKHYHSTVHGAWETGEREANRIFDELRS